MKRPVEASLVGVSVSWLGTRFRVGELECFSWKDEYVWHRQFDEVIPKITVMPNALESLDLGADVVPGDSHLHFEFSDFDTGGATPYWALIPGDTRAIVRASASGDLSLGFWFLGRGTGQIWIGVLVSSLSPGEYNDMIEFVCIGLGPSRDGKEHVMVPRDVSVGLHLRSGMRPQDEAAWAQRFGMLRREAWDDPDTGAGDGGSASTT